MPTDRQVDRALGELGELLSSHEGEADLSEYEAFRDDPVGFSRQVLGDTDPGPWSVQREAMEAVRDHDRVVWRSGQGVGKGWTISRIALWWAYAVRGLVLLSAPTSRTVHETLMRKEIARAHRRAGLPGKLYVNALRIRDDEASILAYTTDSASGGTGHHDRAVLAILDEAQGVDSGAWEAMFANVTGTDDKLFAAGNPVEPAGPFFEVSRPGSGWRTLQTSSREHPNFTDSDTVIPGGPSPEWLARMRDRWGEGSPMWTARVDGQFPDASEHTLVSRSWLDAAEDAWDEHDSEEPIEQDSAWAALDPAGAGPDVSALVVADGWTVREILTWSAPSTMETVGRALHELKERDLDPGRTPIIVDATGVGAGVADRLQEQGAGMLRFESATQATEPDRFLNRRAEAWWRLREALEEELLPIPPDRQLRRDLTSVRWWVNSAGRIQIESKRDLRSRIGRSPDRGDAVAYLVWWLVEAGRQPQSGIAWASPGAGELFGLGQDPRRVVDEDRRDGWRPVNL